MLQFLAENWVDLLFPFLGVFSFVVTFFRTSNVKESINNFKEVLDLKGYHDLSSGKVVSQTFSDTKPDYVLNPVTNELERKPIDKNIQEYIQSFLESSLERALEKFLPQNVTESENTYADYTKSVEDLSLIGESMDIAEEYREKFNLPDNYSMADIYSFVDKQAQGLKSKLAEFNKSKEVEKNVEKKAVE